MNTTLKLQQAEMEHKLTSDMTTVVENLRSLRHDMNNHMSILQGLLSILLNSKISKASQLGIKFETEILTSETPFSERDLCAVIDNVIENAIEASSVHFNIHCPSSLIPS